MYSCHLFLFSSGSVTSLPFLSFIVLTLCVKCSLHRYPWRIPLIFLKTSLVFSILLFSSISLHCSLRKAFLASRDLCLLFFGTLHSDGYIFPFLLCLLLLFLSQLFGRPPQTTILPFCIFFSLGMLLITASCYEPLSIVLQALCLSDLIPWIYLSLPPYNHKGFDLGHTWMV